MADRTPDQIVTIPQALLAPPRAEDRAGLVDRCGVFDSYDQIIPRAQTTGQFGNLTLPVDPPARDGQPYRKGTWLFAGSAYGHFGHALVFSMARLWALDQLETAPDGIVFFARGGTSGGAPQGTLANLLELFSIEVPAHLIDNPEIVETLHVPTQEFSTDTRVTGSDAFRAFVRDRLCAGPIPKGANRLYISRSGLSARKAGVFFADQLDHWMASEGYCVFHPQNHRLTEQVAAYRTADHIVAEDGSALHLAAMVARPEARFAIIATRSHFPQALAAQARSFCGADVTTFEFPQAAWTPTSANTRGLGWFRAHVALDFPGLGTALAEKGFISNPEIWQAPTQDRLDHQVAQYRTALGEPIVSMPLSPANIAGALQ